MSDESKTSHGNLELINRVEKSILGVEAAVDSIEHTNRDLVALTVEVETLREDLADTVSQPESEARKRGLTVAFISGTFGAVEVTDWHLETCRVNPIVDRFQKDNGLSTFEETMCDVSFPFHNHGILEEAGTGLHGANYVGIILYSIIAITLVWWWGKARWDANKAKKERAARDKKARDAAKLIYNGEAHAVTKGAVSDLG